MFGAVGDLALYNFFQASKSHHQEDLHLSTYIHVLFLGDPAVLAGQLRHLGTQDDR